MFHPPAPRLFKQYGVSAPLFFLSPYELESKIITDRLISLGIDPADCFAQKVGEGEFSIRIKSKVHKDLGYIAGGTLSPCGTEYTFKIKSEDKDEFISAVYVIVKNVLGEEIATLCAPPATAAAPSTVTVSDVAPPATEPTDIKKTISERLYIPPHLLEVRLLEDKSVQVSLNTKGGKKKYNNRNKKACNWMTGELREDGIFYFKPFSASGLEDFISMFREYLDASAEWHKGMKSASAAATSPGSRPLIARR